jgi:two-component system, NarL family, nitrate/nitrite response regulator NarL
MQQPATNAEGISCKPIRIAVIDDHPLYRTGTIQVLTQTDGFEVVGEGATAADALKIAQERAPDVILLDLHLPGGGIVAIANIGRDCPNVRTIVLTVSEDAQDVASALGAGARGYILKGSSGSDVIETVPAIARGNSYVAPNLAARILVNKAQIEAVVHDNPHDFTSREEEIFALVSQGLSNKEIARRLSCTERTVKHHMTNIMQKLNVRNRVQAALKFGRPPRQSP